MKSMYVDRATRTIADLVELSPSYYLITRINVPKESRGKKLGSQILREIIEAADSEGVTLEIHPVPSGGLNKRQLIAWYERYGFQLTQSFDPQIVVKVLVREPN